MMQEAKERELYAEKYRVVNNIHLFHQGMSVRKERAKSILMNQFARSLVMFIFFALLLSHAVIGCENQLM